MNGENCGENAPGQKESSLINHRKAFSFDNLQKTKSDRNGLLDASDNFLVVEHVEVDVVRNDHSCGDLIHEIALEQMIVGQISEIDALVVDDRFVEQMKRVATEIRRVVDQRTQRESGLAAKVDVLHTSVHAKKQQRLFREAEQAIARVQHLHVDHQFIISTSLFVHRDR